MGGRQAKSANATLLFHFTGDFGCSIYLPSTHSTDSVYGPDRDCDRDYDYDYGCECEYDCDCDMTMTMALNIST